MGNRRFIRRPERDYHAGMDWTDTEEIAERLHEAHPEVDPEAIVFTKLRRLVEDLDDFEPEPGHRVNEQLLEAIQAAWIEEREDALAYEQRAGADAREAAEVADDDDLFDDALDDEDEDDDLDDDEPLEEDEDEEEGEDDDGSVAERDADDDDVDDDDDADADGPSYRPHDPFR